MDVSILGDITTKIRYHKLVKGKDKATHTHYILLKSLLWIFSEMYQPIW